MTGHDFWRDRVSGWLDGDLDPRAMEAMTAHMAECDACRELRDELSEIRMRARALVDRGPEADLWPLLRAKLGGDAGRRDGVIEADDRFGSARRGPGRGRWWVPAAVAGAALLAGWAAGSVGSAPIGPASDAQGSAGALPVAELRGVGEPALLTEERAMELARLEAVVRSRAAGLDPESRERVERNLALMDRVVAESFRAVSLSPASAWLRAHASEGVQRKERYLRTVAGLLEADD